MISLQKILKDLIWPFLLIMFLSTFLFAEEKKTQPAAPLEAQQDCDQNEQKSTAPDSSVSSPIPLSKEKTANPNPLTPPPLKIQESTQSGG